MRMFRRGRGVDVGTYVAPDPTPPVPIERIVDEGILIAENLVRMKLRNKVIVDSLRDRKDLKRAKLMVRASKQLLKLADNERATAERVRERRENADVSDPLQEYAGYDEDERIESKRRETVHRALADSLAERARDQKALRALIEGARGEAWRDVSAVLEQRATDTARVYIVDSRYAEERDERIAALIALDLAELAAERGFSLHGLA
jgi:hypothetical protein